MRNFTKYSENYLDKMLPKNASCPTCISRSVEPLSIRESGEYLIVSNMCSQCGTTFSVNHHIPTLRAARRKEIERSAREIETNAVQRRQAMQQNTTKEVVKKNVEETEPLTKKERYQKRCFNVSKVFNVLTLLAFIIGASMVATEAYGLFCKYDESMLYKTPVTIVIATAIIIILQIFSVIYEGIGLHIKVDK